MACDESIARLFKFCSHLFGRVAELRCRPLRRINLEIDYRDPSVGPQQLSQLAKVCVFSCVDAPYPPCGGTVLEAARFYSQSDTFSVSETIISGLTAQRSRNFTLQRNNKPFPEFLRKRI